MKNRSALSAMAVSSALFLSLSNVAAFGACAPRCKAKCSPTEMAKCGAKCGAKCSAKCSPKCGPKCGAKSDPKLIQRPAEFKGDYSATPAKIRAGEVLFKNTKLSTNKLSCASCHTKGASYKASFSQPFPHKVEMAYENYGLDRVYLDEAIQMCMLGPMASKTLAWNSPELENLVAFVSEEQKKFIKH